MALGDDIRNLRNQSVTALDASHDYFTFSKRIWKLVASDAREGRRLDFRNPATRRGAKERELIRLAPHYITEYLTSFTFQHFVALFEDFVFGLLRLWLITYPGSLSRKQLEFGTVLRAPDKITIVQMVVDRELNELKYQRVADWFAYIERLTRISCPTAEEIETLSEIKASRDILAHNNGITNAVYLTKAGSRARFREGERLEIPEDYHKHSWETVKKVIQDTADACASKT